MKNNKKNSKFAESKIVISHQSSSFCHFSYFD
jgi:hypothetical protein